MEEATPVKIRSRAFTVRYTDQVALRSIDLDIYPNEIFSIIGPAGSGKTSFLRCLNRINDLVPGLSVSGQLLLDEVDIYSDQIDVPQLRRMLGMVFAVPVPLPGSVYHNITLGPILSGRRSRSELDALVERALRAAYLWDEVKDRLLDPASALSGGQQQRLCLARTLALEPEVLLLDEPCSGLDPISTAKIEEALRQLKQKYTIILVTNNVMQASRTSDRTAFFLQGELVECRPTEEMFTNPQDKRTQEYISGRFG
jgi:phosphate transport system ATP-binding protein